MTGSGKSYQLIEFLKKNWLWVFFLCAVLIRLLIWSRPLVYQEGATLKITGRINSLPKYYGDGIKFRLGKFDIYTKAFDSRLDYDDLISVTGKLQYKNGDLKYGYVIDAQEVARSKQKIGAMRKVLLDWRDFASSAIISNLPEPESGLAAGILLGVKGNIDPDLSQRLRTTGVSHVVVASGTNVSIMAGVIVASLAWVVGRKVAIITALVGVWIFAVIAGMEAPVIRSAIMSSVALITLVLGRGVDGVKLLFLTGLLMLFLNPGLVGDVGFQLSFAATLGIMLSSKRQFKLVPLGFKETLAAQIFTLPVVIANFGLGNVSVIAPVVNLLVLQLVSPIMFGAFVLVVLEILNLIVGDVLKPVVGIGSTIAYVPSHLFMMIINAFT